MRFWVVIHSDAEDRQRTVFLDAPSSSAAITLAEEKNPGWVGVAAGLQRRGEP